MKFNEKLIKLRKKEGLSQEELGYRLNVTRQTVSKWELGQTTPEMDKLVEISKIFNISLDELINESDSISINNKNVTIEQRTIKNNNIREKIIKIILIVLLVIVLGLIVIKLSTLITNKWNEIQQEKQIEEQKRQEEAQKEDVRLEQFYDRLFDKDTDPNNEMDKRMFNASIEMYNGTRTGIHVKALLDNIITSNKTKEKKITVKYGEMETQDETIIKNTKQTFETFEDYEITFEYDEEGFIYKAIIENLSNE